MPTARSLVALSLTVLIASSSLRADQQHIVAPAQVAAAVADRGPNRMQTARPLPTP
jgi:hypothetical protein